METVIKKVSDLIPYINNPMEFDPRYADVIIRRWEEFTGEKAVKIK